VGVNLTAVRAGKERMAKEMITRRLDLRGAICPGPTVDTRLTLKEMAVGEVLEVTTDYYPARQTIPALMSELGYPCELVDGDQPVFRFIIEKAR
jgi:tRNA 2-thiouridine synthesizing protein A